MASDYTFDAVSKVNLTIVSEAIDTAMKEVNNRFDFKDSNSSVSLDAKALELTLASKDDFKVRALWDIVAMRFAKRGLPLKNFEVPEEVEAALGQTARMKVKIIQGIPTDKAKEIIAALKQSGLKVQGSIQAAQLRVSSKSKDALQEAMQFMRTQDFKVDLQFENFR
ncbi:MAG: YajQ family cyclic di-GMP-binding protein [Elusimicrobia bacterium]|nr:YajQ family cyclic di-GMP-binding protein [Elusimicrobiota bacterium]